MKDLISIGNISIDLYFQGESLTRGEDRFTLAIGGKYVADYFYEALGGGGANVAIGASRHGLSAAIIGTIGNNQFKSMILRHLEEHNISRDMCIYKDEYFKISSILLSPNGERTIINYETPHEHIFEKKEDYEQLKKARLVYISNLPRVTLDERYHILSYLHSNNIPSVLNLGIKDCRRPYSQTERLIQKADILMVNSHEFAELIKRAPGDIDLKKDIRHYISPTFQKTVIITDGEKGSWAYSQQGVHHVPAAVPKKVVDTTGAGDAYSAGFISGYLKNESNIQMAMEIGAKYAARIIAKVGAN
ncbi:MAG: carbohydrate kinase family protein [Patescibacteria group bacterium]